MKFTLEKILDYKQKGFLFHGSPNGNIKVIEPRAANDADSENEYNNDTAVFAADDPGSSILFAVVNRSIIPDELQKYDWEVNWELDGKVYAKLSVQWKEILEKNIGYLYVLPSDSFSKKPEGGQYKSYEKVIPTNVIKVKLKDAIELGITIEWF